MTTLLNFLSKVCTVLFIMLLVCSCENTDPIPDPINQEPKINDPNRDFPIDSSETFTQEELIYLDELELVQLDWDNIILPSGMSLKELNDADPSNGRLKRTNSLPEQRKEEIIKLMFNEARRLMNRSDFIKAADEVQGVRPAQPNGLAYGLGLKNYTRRQNPDGPCYEEVYGLDCSGLLSLLAAKAGLIGAPSGSINQGNPNLWNAALKKEVKNEGLAFKKISNLSKEKLENGDLIIWRGHVGVIAGTDNSLFVLQSNGGDGKHCMRVNPSTNQMEWIPGDCIEIEHEKNRGLKRGPWPIPIKLATNKDIGYWGTNFTVLRLEASNPWFKELIGRWTYQAYFKLNDDLYEKYNKNYNDNIDNNPCGMGFTLIGNDSILGSNTILWYEPVLTWEVEFNEDFTMYAHNFAFDQASSTVCETRENGSLMDLKWKVNSTGFIEAGPINGGYSLVPTTGQLVKIDENTFYTTYQSCLDNFCNSSYTLLRRK